MIVGDSAADQEAWHRVIADVIDQLKNPKDKGEDANAAPPSTLTALTRDVSAPVTISPEQEGSVGAPQTQGGANNEVGVGTSLPSSYALSSDSPPVLAPVSNGSMEPMPAPASGSFKNKHNEGDNRSPAHSQEDASTASPSASTSASAPHHATSDADASSAATNAATGGSVVPSSPSQQHAGHATSQTSSPSHSGSGAILSSSPARKTGVLDQRIPAIAALDEPSSGSASPAPGQLSSDSQNATGAVMRHPSVSHLQSTNAKYSLVRRPSLSNLLVPVPKAAGCFDIHHLNAADIEGQLALLADDLKFISNALSWREAPVLDLASFEASIASLASLQAPTDVDQYSQSSTPVHDNATPASVVSDAPVTQTEELPQETPSTTAALEVAIAAATETPSQASSDISSDSTTATTANTTSQSDVDSTSASSASGAFTVPPSEEPVQNLDPEPLEKSNHSDSTNIAVTTTPAGPPSAFSQLHSDFSSSALHSSHDERLGASTSSMEDHQQFEAVPTVTTKQDASATLPSIPSVDPKTHPRLSSRWPSPRSSLTQQLFLALDSATDADREAMLDDIIGDIDDATSTTPVGFRSASARDYNDAETTADLLAALMDPEHSTYSASPSSFHASPLELAMNNKNASSSYSNVPSSSGVGSGATLGDQSSAPSDGHLEGQSSDLSSATTGISSATNAGGADGTTSEKANDLTFAGSDSESPRGPSSSGDLKASGSAASGIGGGWTRPERRPTAAGFATAASSHRTATATEIQQLEKMEGDSRLRRLRERLISPEDPYELYDCSERAIGKGGMGEVFFATIKRQGAGGSGSHKKMAIKKLQTFFKGKDRLPTILNEINVMAHSKHPNIINYIASYQVEQELWVAMEYMDKGSLYDLVRLNIKLDEKHMAYIIKQIVYALTFIHDLKRVHRDIKVDNVLMSSRGEIKLADFGAAVQLTFQRLKRTTMTGTPYYMSPEVIGGKQYDELVDVWSLGILCIELAERAPPYYDLPPDQALDRIVKDGVKGLQGRRYSSDFLDFVNNKCLQFEPSKRWTASQLQNHPFLKKAVTQQEFAAHLDSLDSMSQVDSGCTIL